MVTHSNGERSPDALRSGIITNNDPSTVGDRSSVRVMLTNIRSVMNKRDELEELVAREFPSMIALTETWLSGDVTDSEVII